VKVYWQLGEYSFLYKINLQNWRSVKVDENKSYNNETGECMNNNDYKESTEIKELIMKAIQDPDFKQLLIHDPDKAFENFNLTDVQKQLIKTLSEEDINKLTVENLEEYFSADAAVYTPDIDADMQIDEAEEDDI